MCFRVANFQDITDRKRYETELKTAIAVREEFLSIASHELRTPLTSLGLLLEGLERSFDEISADAGRVRRKLASAVRQADRLSELIDSLLSVSRIAAGPFEIEPEEFDLSALAREVLERFDEEAKRSKSSIELRAPERALVYLDRTRIDRALMNLLSNAIKYGLGKAIHLDVILDDTQVRVAVRDHGMGIAVSDQKRVFGRFERAVSSNHYGGLGLGLYIIEHIAQAHGGSIGVTSRPGEGSTFTLTLPRRAMLGTIPKESTGMESVKS